MTDIGAESYRIKNPIDGIIYTSVEHSSGFNLALNPSLIEQNKIVIENVAKHFLRKSSMTSFDNFIEPNMLTNIDFKNNKIEWV